MARTPTKAPAKRQVRRVVAEPVSQSRAAGAPAPASAAATAPRATTGFYEPDGGPVHESGQSAPETAFAAQVRATSIDLKWDSIDVGAATTSLEFGMAPEGETVEQAIERLRPMRRQLGTLSQKLALPKRAGYHTHWFNGEGSRIDDAVANGWTFRQKDGRPIKRAVGTGRDKGVLYAYAMDIPEVFWREDMDARNKDAQARVDGLKASPFKAPRGSMQQADSGKFYSPDDVDSPLTITKGS